MTLLSDLIDGSILPPKAVDSTGVAGDNNMPYLPTKVAADGEFFIYPPAANGAISFYDETDTIVWTIANAAAILAGYDQWVGGFWWDTVESRLYALVIDYGPTPDTMQLAWIDPTTGAITLVGAAFNLTEALWGALGDSSSLSRATMGSGEFILRRVVTGSIIEGAIPAVGGSIVETTDIQPSGVKFAGVFPYKTSDNIYIGSLSAWTAATPKQTVSMAYGPWSGVSVPVDINIGGAAINSFFQDWGGDVAVINLTVGARSGAALLDKTDFDRWVKEVAIANGAPL